MGEFLRIHGLARNSAFSARTAGMIACRAV
jgi:hypothetical protein